jgi:PAS domain S-box-containing protein
VDSCFEFSTAKGSSFKSNLKFLRATGHSEQPVSICILPSENPTEISTPTDPDDEDLHAMLQLFPEAAFSIDNHGLLVDANPMVSPMFQMNAKQIAGKPVAIFRSHSPQMAEQLARLSGAEDTLEQEFQIARPDGSTAWVSLSTRRLKMREGSRASHLAWVRYLGRHVLRAKELQIENSRLEGYMHSIAHDLRSPLVSMLGFTQLLRRDYDDVLDESGRRFTERIERGAKEMDSLIENFLELARIDFDPNCRTMIDSKHVLLELQKELSSRLERLGVELVSPETCSPIFSDRTYLYRILSNLVVNSLEHMGDCSFRRIEVNIEDQTDCQIISVRDYGQGFPLEDSEKVFEPFYSRPSAETRKTARGLGLTMVQKVAEAHGGRAWAESESGLGCCIRVRLPIR